MRVSLPIYNTVDYCSFKERMPSNILYSLIQSVNASVNFQRWH
jgi:hypothetical protein